MAISKERLKELILKGDKIYDSWHGNEFCVRNIEKIEDDVVTYSFLLDKYKTTLEDLHEDYEYFKWYEEFGCIEITERLQLPTWEDVMKDLNGKIGTFVIAEDYKHNFVLEVFLTNKTGLKNRIQMTGLRDLELTKENYTLACRKAKELFLKGDEK